MVIVMRAMGMESDQEIMELIGSEPGVAALMASTVQEAKAAGIYTKQQALDYLGAHQLRLSPSAAIFLPRNFSCYLSEGRHLHQAASPQAPQCAPALLRTTA